MTTNTKRKIIVTAALLLLIMVAVSFLNYKSSNNIGLNGNLAAMTREGVTNPTDEALHKNSNADNANIASEDKSPEKRHRFSGASKIAIVDDDQFSLSASAGYAGNIPVLSLAAYQAMRINKPQVYNLQNIAILSDQLDNTKNKKAERVNFAPEIGVNFNDLYNNNASTLSTNDFHGGILMNVRLKSAFALQTGLLYIVKRNQEKSVSSTTSDPNGPMALTTTTKIGLQYLELPLNLVYKFGDMEGAPRYMVGAGPYVSYLINAQDDVQTVTKDNHGSIVNTKNTTSNSTSNMKKMDYGAGGFIGLQMPKGFYGKVGAEWGFREIKDPVNGKPVDRNYTIMVTLGYLIGSQNSIY